MVIFHSHISLPEGTKPSVLGWLIHLYRPLIVILEMASWSWFCNYYCNCCWYDDCSVFFLKLMLLLIISTIIYLDLLNIIFNFPMGFPLLGKSTGNLQYFFCGSWSKSGLDDDDDDDETKGHDMKWTDMTWHDMKWNGSFYDLYDLFMTFIMIIYHYYDYACDNHYS
jgi:hypothetical protein